MGESSRTTRIGPERAGPKDPGVIEQAEATLEDSGVIANGSLRLDPQEWVRPSRSVGGARRVAARSSGWVYPPKEER